MAQVIKSPDIALQHRRILLLVSLLYILLLPSQLWALPYNHFGVNKDTEKLSPYPAFHEEDSYVDDEDLLDDVDDDLQDSPTLPRATAAVNPDSNSGAQSTESQGTLALAINIFRQAAQVIPGNFVMSPDGLFQSLALLLTGADGATRQLLQSCLGDDYSEPAGAAASSATACGQDEYCVANCLLLSNSHGLQETYREKLKQINADIRDNVDFSASSLKRPFPNPLEVN
uniref:serpin family protein n=1 Tax=Endozoicomonas sp. SESOKO2 TaxID=2828743 RepID=UPI0021497C34